MLSGIEWMPFLLTTLLVAVIPGPEMVLAVGRSVIGGRCSGLLIVLGGFLGLSVHVTAAALGLSAILVSSPTVFLTVKYSGALYLMYLGVRELLVRSRPVSLETQPLNLRQSCWQGFVTALFNPQTTLFILALLPQFVRLEGGGASDLALKLGMLGMLFNLITTLPIIALVLLASVTSSGLRQSPRFSKHQNLISGSLFMGLGVWFLF